MKIFYSLILSAFIFLSFLVTPIFAQNLPVSLEKTAPLGQLSLKSQGVSGANNTVKGVLTIENKTGNEYRDLIYSVELRAPATTTKGNIDGSVVNIVNQGLPIEYITSEKFSLKPGEKKDVVIAIPYQSTVVSGNYEVFFSLRNNFGSVLATDTRNLLLTGSGDYLSIDPNSCILKADGVDYAATDGPLINPDSPIEASCIVTNQSSAGREVVYAYKYAVGYVIGYPFSRVNEYTAATKISFGAKESKRVNFILPALSEPQVYEALVYFVSGNTKTSPLTPFRWIVKGASASITGVTLNQETYASGTSAQITVNANPSIDLYWRGTPNPLIPGFGPDKGTNLTSPKLLVTLIDKDNNECGKTEQDLPKIESDLSWQTQNITVPITRNCPSAKARVTISDSGKILSEVEVSYDPAGVKEKPEDQIVQKNNYLKWVLGALVVLVIVGVVVIVIRKRRGKPGSGMPIPVATGTTTVVTLILISGFYIGTSVNFSPIMPRKFEVRAQEASGSATPSASASATITPSPTASGSTGLVVPWGDNPPSFAYPADIFKTPINAPPGAVNIYMDRTWSGNNVVRYFSNFHDFVQKDASGLSQFRINGECGSFAIDFSGFSGSTHYCDNIGNGVGVQAYIDGVNVGIINPTSPNSSYLKGTELIVFGKPDGFRNASFTLNPPALMAGGAHRVELIVRGLGVYVGNQGGQQTFGSITAYSTATDGTFDPRFTNCGAPGKSCVGKLDYVFSCPVKCPNPGETNPHGECNGFACTQVNTCGVTKCGKNSDCGGCDDPNQTRPHMGCVGLSCSPVDTCGTPTCTDSAQCCPPGEKNPHTVCDGNNCSVVNSCGVDGCTQGQTKPHGVCDGAACTQSNACGLAECSSDTECFNDNMCKCDGFTADMVYPGNSFNFEAFAKVEGNDIKKAEIQDITFTMTRDNTIVAKSSPIKPEVVETSASKVRLKAKWSTPPPQVSRDSTYRVFAQIKCKPKKKATVANASLISDSVVLGASKTADSVRLPAGQVLAETNSSPVPSASTDTSLQLRTLNFVKMLETDSCKSVIFKYDETLF